MEGLSAYQRMRRANLNENTEYLKEYGIEAPVAETTSLTIAPKERKKKLPVKKREKRFVPKEVVEERRASFRVRLRVKADYFEDYEPIQDSDEEDDLQNLRLPDRTIVRPPRPNTFGSIKGVAVGTWWETRLDCNYDGIHRPTVAGIHQGPDGAYSVALSGGYEDDIDLGDSFTYTGEGGRDLKGTVNKPKNLRTAPQSKHQSLVRGNLALSRNVETGNPVRVIRGYKLNSKFAPARGYRYDGLYKVAKYWETTGKAGYKVYKFSFERCDPEPAPWCKNNKPSSPIKAVPWKADTDWHGWPTETALETGCLSVEHVEQVERVKLIGDQWHKVTESGDGGGETGVTTCVTAPEHEPVDNIPSSNSVNSPGGGRRSENIETPPLDISNEADWCGWDVQATFICVPHMAIKYKGHITRVCEEGEKWREVSFEETASV